MGSFCSTWFQSWMSWTSKPLFLAISKMLISASMYLISLLSDFDFGVELLRQMAKQCNFPWLMSNVDDQERNAPLAGGNLFHSKNIWGYIWSIFAGEKSLLLEWQGVKVGLIGLVEEEWLHTLSNMPKNILFHDFVTEGQRLTDELRYCLFILLFFYVCK